MISMYLLTNATHSMRRQDGRSLTPGIARRGSCLDYCDDTGNSEIYHTTCSVYYARLHTVYLKLTRFPYIRHATLRLLHSSEDATLIRDDSPTHVQASTSHSYQTLVSSVCLHMLTSTSESPGKWMGCYIISQDFPKEDD